MTEELKHTIDELVHACGNDPTRLMDVVRGVQSRLGCVSEPAMEGIAAALGIKRVDVEAVVSFYAFLSSKDKGQTVIRVCDCVPCRMKGADAILARFESALGIQAGQTTAGGVTLETTPCIGLCDQAPAALLNDYPLTELTEERVDRIVSLLAEGKRGEDLLDLGWNHAEPVERIRHMVCSNVREWGSFILVEMDPGAALRRALAQTPQQVINHIKVANLCGRGGAGFPTGLKWQFARAAQGEHKYVLCNADEGEPGTFKDRVLLTERPDLVFEGMTIAAWAIGSEEGVLYLRAEYAYLLEHLQLVLAERRRQGLLGDNILGNEGFNFDIRIQMGAGAYICGEESALIESCEGKRGSPRTRPPFPVQKGYLDHPTVVNNVETFCGATNLLFRGHASIGKMGFGQSKGTKLYSVSGDCERPGVYELPFGLTLTEFLQLVGGEDAIAVQVGGPSGTLVSRKSFGRKLTFEDLATGGSMIVFGPDRDLLEVVSDFMAFFIHESCGWCVPCRVGNVLVKKRLDRIRAGKGLQEDIPYLEALCSTIKKTSRCGLGQTSTNPVQSLLAEFSELLEARMLPGRQDGRQPSFDLDAALAPAVIAQGRAPVFHD